MTHPHHQSPVDAELEALICACLDVLLTTLPPEQARVVRAVDVEGAPLPSVADTNGLDLGEARALLARGRQGLQARFGQMHKIRPSVNSANCGCCAEDDVETR